MHAARVDREVGLLGFCLTWLVAAAGYVLLVGQIDPTEATAAALCGLLAALWSVAIRRTTRARFAYPQGGAAAVLRALAGVPVATVRVGAVLLRGLGPGVAGDATDQPFRHGARRDPIATGRRAIAVLGLSLAPDSVVLRTPEQQDLIVVHRLGSGPGRPDAEWPV